MAAEVSPEEPKEPTDEGTESKLSKVTFHMDEALYSC